MFILGLVHTTQRPHLMGWEGGGAPFPQTFKDKEDDSDINQPKLVILKIKKNNDLS